MVQQNKKYNLIIKEKGLGELKKIVGGLDKTNRSLKRVQKTSKQTASTLGSLRSRMTALIAVLSVREIARFTDEVQLLTDRLGVFANEGETGVEVLEQLNDVAQETRGSVTALGEAYNRIAINTKDLGLDTQDLLNITQALQQTFRLSGASTAEATSSMIQLTQGMAQGELRGQELRSVLEGNAIFGGLLAEKLGVARGELIKLGEAGALKTNVVLEVLRENFEELNAQAAKLRPTFEQGVIFGLNELRLGLNEVNSEYNVSGGFFKSIKLIVENIDSLKIIIGALVAANGLPLLVTQLGKLRLALIAASAGNPIGAITVGLTALGIAANETFKALAEDDTEADFRNNIETKKVEIDLLSKSIENLKNSAGFWQGLSNVIGDGLSEKEDDLKKLRLELIALEGQLIAIENSKKTKVSKAVIEDAQEEATTLKELNRLYKNGAIGLADYKEAQLDLQIEELTKSVDDGSISWQEYDEKLLKVKEDLGLVSEEQFKLADAFREGSKSYLESIGTLSEGVASVVNNSFKSMEDTLVEFVKTGKLNFADLADSIISDMLRIAIQQQITGVLAGAIGSAFTPSAATTTTGTTFLGNTSPTITQANGGAWSGGNVIPFANGGVVNGPTNFAMSGGRAGLMGEAGPEAIMPIERIGGKLGVNAKGLGSNVTVNIINNSDSGVDTQEREGPDGERIIEVLIDRKVKESFASGKLDSTMKSNFGIKRVGV